ncbi:agrin-like [Haliotis rubra]|uniref:agrin-like n=1 Tax=Haliotis rubra TaxID=36100 RepID=UPI001EE5FFEA|nr:agrin-like [Haliotis rubra]
MRLLILEAFLLVGILEYAHADDGGVACGIVDQLVCDDFAESRVCGSDGRDYFNDCDFAKAHCHDSTLHVGNVGQCRTSTTATTTPPSTHPANANLLCKVLLAAQCNGDAKELCGTDGKTYFNLCKFEQAKCSSPALAVDHTGECVTPSPLCQAFAIVQCGETRKEVCASNNVTFPNLCSFEKAQCLDTSLSLVREGSCDGSHTPGTSPPSTTPTSLPDTSTAPNRPSLSPTCRALVIALCGSNVEAMCGSNGITYANPCQLKKAECFDPSIKLVSVGHCASPTLAITQSTTSKPTTSQATAQKTQGSTSSLPMTSQDTTQKTQGSTTSLPMTSQDTTQKTKGSTTSLPMTSQDTTQNTQGSTSSVPMTSLETSQKTQGSTTSLPMTSKETTQTTQGSTTSLPMTSQETTQTTQGSTTSLPMTSKETTQTTQESTTPLPSTSGSTMPVMTLSPLDIICRAIMNFDCPITPEPVCGSDGKTYPNECEFEKAKCTHRHLHVASFGPCN